jgi:hypothetical protein
MPDKAAVRLGPRRCRLRLGGRGGNAIFLPATLRVQTKSCVRGLAGKTAQGASPPSVGAAASMNPITSLVRGAVNRYACNGHDGESTACDNRSVQAYRHCHHHKSASTANRITSARDLALSDNRTSATCIFTVRSLMFISKASCLLGLPAAILFNVSS